MAVDFDACNINDSRVDLSYCTMEIQLISVTVMAKGEARERQGVGAVMMKKIMEGGNQPGNVLCS